MSVVTVTDAAAAHARKLLSAKPEAAGLRLGTRAYGCSGLAYTVDYVDAIDPMDECVEHGDFKLYVDRKALLHILGTVMDYEDGMFATGFTFTNPNETGRCGCGESFTVKPDGAPPGQNA